METPTSPQPAPPPPPPDDRVGGWLPVLVVLALAIGLTVSWAVHERRSRSQLASRLQGVAKDAAVTQAKAAELSTFLLDPETRLVHLRGTGTARDRTAAVAWNPARGQGVVLVDPGIPTPLRLLAHPAAQPPVQLLQLNPGLLGGHPFHLPANLPPTDVTFTLEPPPATPGGVRYEPHPS